MLNSTENENTQAYKVVNKKNSLAFNPANQTTSIGKIPMEFL